MEAFSLLKYWRGGGGGRGGVAVDGGANVRSAGTGTTTIVTAVSHHVSETDDDDDDDDGPFFDLEFALPDDDDDGDDQPKHEDSDCAEERDDDREEEEEIESNGTEGENEEREFKFTLSSGSSSDRNDPNVSLSPSDDLFFKGRLVPIEPSSMNLNDSESNAAKSQFSLLKSATKFRVMMLKFKKSKANVIEKTEPNGSASATPKQQQQQQQKAEEPKQNQNQTQSKFLTVKFKVEEVPIMSLFTRDNSSRATNKSQKQQNSDESASYEKRFSKDSLQRYLKKVKPLYVRVSKRYGEKLRFSGQLSLGSSGGTKTEPSPPTNSPPAKSTAAQNESEPSELTEPPPPPTGNAKSQKQGNLPAGLRVVCKHLGKSRSASSAASPSGSIQSKRRDDSLLQQQDGIQSAILHCKRSFNASRDSDSSLLSRSVSDSLHEKSSHLSKKCSEELKGAGGVGCI